MYLVNQHGGPCDWWLRTHYWKFFVYLVHLELMPNENLTVSIATVQAPKPSIRYRDQILVRRPFASPATPRRSSRGANIKPWTPEITSGMLLSLCFTTNQMRNELNRESYRLHVIVHIYSLLIQLIQTFQAIAVCWLSFAVTLCRTA